MFFQTRNVLGSQIEASELAFNTFDEVYGTVLTAAATNIEITGLDSSDDGPYLLLLCHKEGSGSTTPVKIFVNGDTTETNYYVQTARFNNATISGNRVNVTRLGETNSSNRGFYNVMVGAADGYFHSISECVKHAAGTAIEYFFYVTVKTAQLTDSKISQLDITAANANSFAIGTEIRLFRARNYD